MEVLYRSKGISKTAVAKKVISIIVCLILAFVLIMIGSSKTKGSSQMISVGGGAARSVSLEKNRYSAEEQQGFAALALMAGLLAVIDAGLLAGCRISWTEIHTDSVQGSCMGKSVSYPLAEITQISEFGNYLIVAGSAGKIVLVVDDPKKTHKLLNKLVRQQKR